MEDFEVNITRLRDEIDHMEAIINEYEECIELIGHLMRMFNKEGYWDFKDRILVIGNQVMSNENNLKELVKSMNQIYMDYKESEYIEGDVHLHQNNQVVLESDSIINLGIQIRLAVELKVPIDNIDRLTSIRIVVNNKGYECYNIKYNTKGYQEEFVANNIDNMMWQDYINKISQDINIFTYE